MATQHLLAEPDEGFDDFPCDVLAENCPSRAALEHIAGRWGSLVLVALRKGPTRFNELRRRVNGVSEKMLAQSLHALERDGIVVREVHSTIPPRVEYSLTPLGEQTADKLWELVAFLQDSMPQVLTARQAYDESTVEG
jgi:DNA-binding HxlR family transcriptional regulator